eukprot:752854-Hanusia_phi.AAC.5
MFVSDPHLLPHTLPEQQCTARFLLASPWSGQGRISGAARGATLGDSNQIVLPQPNKSKTHKIMKVLLEERSGRGGEGSEESEKGGEGRGGDEVRARSVAERRMARQVQDWMKGGEKQIQSSPVVCSPNSSEYKLNSFTPPLPSFTRRYSIVVMVGRASGRS